MDSSFTHPLLDRTSIGAAETFNIGVRSSCQLGRLVVRGGIKPMFSIPFEAPSSICSFVPSQLGQIFIKRLIYQFEGGTH